MNAPLSPRPHVGGHAVGDGEPVFCVAEVGTTANGDPVKGKELIRVAAEAGFDAVKFQTIDPEQISDKTAVYRYQTLGGPAEENMYEMFKKLVFPPDQWTQLADEARRAGILFFSSIDYPAGVDMLLDCGVEAFKIGSWDVTYEPLVARVAKAGKPIFFDLGPVDLSDVLRFADICREHGNTDLVPVHDFHTDLPGQMHMRTIPFLKRTLGCPVGFSAPGRNHDLDVMAVALGANMLEKRVTLDRATQAHHHVLCLEPRECRPWIERIRFAEASLGREGLTPSDADRRDATRYFRSLCATAPIRRGQPFSRDNLDGKRPGTGIPTFYLDIFLDRPARRDIAPDTLLEWEDL